MEATPRGSGPAERTADRSFTCTFCGNTFSRSHALQLHLRIHAGERYFAETSYVRTIASASRQRVKAGERLYVCDVCGQRFTIASFLARHQRAHTAEQPLECDLCGQTFASAANHREHRRRHAREPTDRCEVCGDHYPGPQRLARHQRTHLQPEPHLCGVCGMSFGRLHYLQWHQRIHGGPPGSPRPQPVTSTSPTRKIPPSEAGTGNGGEGAAGGPARGRKRPVEREQEAERAETIYLCEARCRFQERDRQQHPRANIDGGQSPIPESRDLAQPDTGGVDGDAFLCEVCGADFVHWLDLQGHQRLHRPVTTGT